MSSYTVHPYCTTPGNGIRALRKLFSGRKMQKTTSNLLKKWKAPDRNTGLPWNNHLNKFHLLLLVTGGKRQAAIFAYCCQRKTIAVDMVRDHEKLGKPGTGKGILIPRSVLFLGRQQVFHAAQSRI